LAGTIISIMLGTVYLLPMLLIFCHRYSFKLDRKILYLPPIILILCIFTQILGLALSLTMLTSIYVLTIIILTSITILSIKNKI